ncbi:hypothetical protein GGI42DRAFT_199694 [Trichoderma sp. SZMC 28013]
MMVTSPGLDTAGFLMAVVIMLAPIGHLRCSQHCTGRQLTVRSSKAVLPWLLVPCCSISDGTGKIDVPASSVRSHLRSRARKGRGPRHGMTMGCRHRQLHWMC